MLKRWKVLFAAALCLALCLNATADAAMLRKEKVKPGSQKPAPTQKGRSVLPRKGDIAVVVDGADEKFVHMAETAIIESLIQHGYRVVDEAKMKGIRAAAARAKAARLALIGDVAGILRISSGYSVAATVVAHVTVGETKENQFKLLTGTASIELLGVISNGTKLGGKTAESKQVGYTQDETQRKALRAAVDAGMAQMY